MYKIILLSTFFILTGCATNSDIEKLQAQIDSANSKISLNNDTLQSEIDAIVAKCAIQHKNCVEHCKSFDEKLNRLFKKSSLK